MNILFQSTFLKPNIPIQFHAILVTLKHIFLVFNVVNYIELSMLSQTVMMYYPFLCIWIWFLIICFGFLWLCS